MEMKKWLALALAGTMCFSMLTACGGDDEEYVEEDDVAEEDVIEDDEEYVEDEEPAAAGISEETWARICVANAYMAYEIRNLKAQYLDQGEMPDTYAEIEVPLWDLLEANKGLTAADYDEDSAAAYMAELETYLEVLNALVPLDIDAALAEAGLVPAE